VRKFLAGLMFWLLMFGTAGSAWAAEQSAGLRAASFALKDLAGTTYSLADYRDKKPVLLFFWTTWCPYCLTKLRLMNSEYAALEKDGIALLAVNAGERRSSVERLVRNYGIRYTVLLDESSAATESYRILGVPTFILIDARGVIQYKGNDYPRSAINDLSGKR